MTETNEYESLGFVLIKFSDFGPMALVFENTTFPEDVQDAYGAQLGTYLNLMINKGDIKKESDDELQIGLFGPYPWSQTPDLHCLAFSFFGVDKDSTKPVYMILAVFYKLLDLEMIKARISVENALARILIKEKVTDYPSVELESINLLFSQIKTNLYKSVKEGDSLIQENALDDLMSNERLKYLGLYSLENRELIATVVGDEEEFKDLISEIKALNFEIIFTTFQSFRFGLIKLEKYSKIVILILSGEEDGKSSIFMEKDFMDLYRSIYVSAPLLEDYFSA